MSKWLLGKLSGTVMVYLVYALLGLNVAQFVGYKVGGWFEGNKLTTLAVSDALKGAELLKAEQRVKDANVRADKKDKRIIVLSQQALEREERIKRWKFTGLKYKALYKARCKDDEDCESWSFSDYRGDG